MDIQRFMKGQIWTYEPHAEITKIRNPLLGRQHLMLILSVKAGLKVIPITTIPTDSRYGVSLDTNNKMYALCNQIQTIEFKDLISFYGQISEDKLLKISTKVHRYFTGELRIKTTDSPIRTIYDENQHKQDIILEVVEEVLEPVVEEHPKSVYDTLDEKAKHEFLSEPINYLIEKYYVSRSTVSRYRRMIKAELEGGN